MTRSAKEVAAAWEAAASWRRQTLTAVGTAAWRAPDPVELLKERYVSGYDTLEQFERYVEQTLREERA